jgi:hypothetical protein
MIGPTLGDRFRQARLADPGLARDQEKPALSAARLPQARLELLELALAAYKRDVFSCGPYPRDVRIACQGAAPIR